MVSKPLIPDNFYIGRVWCLEKSDVSTLKECGGLKRTDFCQFFHCWRKWWFSKDWFLAVSTLRGCGGLKRLNFNSFQFGRMWGLERTYVGKFPHWEDVVVLKGLILDNFHFRRV